MWAPVIVTALCITGAHAFLGVGLRTSSHFAVRPHSCAQMPSMSGSGYATTRAGKAKTIETVNSLLQKSTLVFSVPGEKVTANQVVKLRKGLPETCTMKVVKNKLMRRACVDTPFELLSEVTTGQNCWLFVEGDENMAEPIKMISEFAKENFDRDTPEWQTPIRSGVYEGEVLDTQGVLAISKLPSKQELMQRLAFALQSVPTKLGKSIKLVPTKVGRVVKLAFAEEDGEGSGDSAEASANAGEGDAAAEAAPEGESADALPAAEDAPAAAE